VRENIRLGRPGASDAEVEAAARAAELEEAIEALPRGYETVVGERGQRLSGGQRQRVALARAIIRDPAVLLLDEATSALDPATEAQINATIARLARGRTVVTVTHRLTSVVEADWIVVLERGRLVEQGRHADLLERDGAYRRLWRRQSGFAVSGDGRQAAVDADRLRLIPLFAGLDDAALASLADRFSTRPLEAGDLVCREGEPGDEFYIVARGQLEAQRRGADGQPRRIARMDDGDFFGEIALLRDRPRTATVRAVTAGVLLALDRGQFDRLLAAAPGVRAIVEQAARDRLGADG
jgi:ATP-binding cassette subfamily B protein